MHIYAFFFPLLFTGPKRSFIKHQLLLKLTNIIHVAICYFRFIKQDIGGGFFRYVTLLFLLLMAPYPIVQGHIDNIVLSVRLDDELSKFQSEVN